MVQGSLRSGSYYNAEGYKVYTTEILAEKQYFAEGKKEIAPDRELTHEEDNLDALYEEYLREYSSV